MLGNMFHTPKAKKFYIPNRFYDPDKEEREMREKRIKEELGISDEKDVASQPYKPNIKGSFRMAEGMVSKTTNQTRRSNTTRLIIFIIILIFIYLVFFKFNFTFFK